VSRDSSGAPVSARATDAASSSGSTGSADAAAGLPAASAGSATAGRLFAVGVVVAGRQPDHQRCRENDRPNAHGSSPPV